MLNNRFVLAAALAVLTAACASQAVYRPAEREGAVGYSETKLGATRYRVTFNGDSGTRAGTIEDAALLRAAELTQQKGYDWFTVANRHLDKSQRTQSDLGGEVIVPPETTVYRECGLVTCQTTVAQSPGFVTGAGVGTTTTRSEYSATLEILMGKNPKPRKTDAYDAREVAGNLAHLKTPRS